jgi:hypothetical protein
MRCGSHSGPGSIYAFIYNEIESLFLRQIEITTLYFFTWTSHSLGTLPPKLSNPDEIRWWVWLKFRPGTPSTVLNKVQSCCLESVTIQQMSGEHCYFDDSHAMLLWQTSRKMPKIAAFTIDGRSWPRASNVNQVPRLSSWWCILLTLLHWYSGKHWHALHPHYLIRRQPSHLFHMPWRQQVGAYNKA